MCVETLATSDIQVLRTGDEEMGEKVEIINVKKTKNLSGFNLSIE